MEKKKKSSKKKFSIEEARFFEASGSARQTALELYKVFSKYIYGPVS